MTLLTPAEARQKACPFFREAGVPKGKPAYPCLVSDCHIWRWKAISANDPRFLSAVTREASTIQAEADAKGKIVNATKIAAERVGFNVDDYIIRTDEDKGWCGLGGRPE